jgi:hypothetical protein
MQALKLANLALRFLLELCLLAAVGAWAYRLGGSAFTSIILSVGAALAVATIWGAFLAPKAVRRLPPTARLVLELILFGAAALGLWQIGAAGLGLALFAAYIINKTAIILWRQDA